MAEAARIQNRKHYGPEVFSVVVTQQSKLRTKRFFFKDFVAFLWNKQRS